MTLHPRIRSVSLGLAVVGLCALGPASARADDRALQQRVEARLDKAGLRQAGDIGVDVRDGGVTLSGAVLTVEAERAAERAARKETRSVVNQLRVVPVPRSDSEIARDVRRAVLTYPRYTIFDSIDFAVDQGIVLLRGSVLQPYRKNDIDERIARIGGVREVRNEVAVQGVSLFDDQLRRQLAVAIYRQPLLQRYAFQPDPPIHIVVDRGRITLTGYVGSRVEQVLVGNIARSSLAFGVDNRVKVDGDPPEADRKPDPRS